MVLASLAAFALSLILLSSVFLISLDANSAAAESQMVKVGTRTKTMTDPYTLQVVILNPRDSAYSLDFVIFSNPEGEFGGYNIPAGWSLASDEGNTIIFITDENPIVPGKLTTFEVSSHTKMGLLLWAVDDRSRESDEYVESGIKSVGARWFGPSTFTSDLYELSMTYPGGWTEDSDSQSESDLLALTTAIDIRFNRSSAPSVTMKLIASDMRGLSLEEYVDDLEASLVNEKVWGQDGTVVDGRGAYLINTFTGDNSYTSRVVIDDGGTAITLLYSASARNYVQYYNDFQDAYRSIDFASPPPKEPAGGDSDYIERHYEWTYADQEWTWDLSFSKSLYDYYKNKPRPATADYSLYATDSADDEMISQLVELIEEAATDEGWGQWETLNFVISFVQSLEYTADSVTTPFDEYPRYPIETLVENGGDCEDTSILVSEMITKLGIDVILISPPGHMAVGVACTDCTGTYYAIDERDYFFVETTGEGWQVGEIPDEYAGESVDYYRLTPKPMTDWEWTSELLTYDRVTATYTIRMTVENTGTAAAENLIVLAQMDTTTEGRVWDYEQSDPINMLAGESYIFTFNLTVPRNEYTRIHIYTWADNLDTEESTGKWFDVG